MSPLADFYNFGMPIYILKCSIFITALMNFLRPQAKLYAAKLKIREKIFGVG